MYLLRLTQITAAALSYIYGACGGPYMARAYMYTFYSVRSKT